MHHRFPIVAKPLLQRSRFPSHFDGVTVISPQGHFKLFLFQNDEHLLTVMRYVERNRARAHLIARPEEWRWGSARVRAQKSQEHP